MWVMFLIKAPDPSLNRLLVEVPQTQIHTELFLLLFYFRAAQGDLNHLDFYT